MNRLLFRSSFALVLGFTLTTLGAAQSAASVPSTNWITLTNSPAVVSNICYFTNSITTGNQFFRLAKP